MANEILDMLMGADDAYEREAEGAKLTDLPVDAYTMLLTGIQFNAAPFTVGTGDDKIEHDGVAIQARFQGLTGDQEGKEYDGEPWFLPDLRRLGEILATLPDKGRGSKFGVQQNIRTISKLVRMILKVDKSRSPADLIQVNDLAQDNYIEVTFRVQSREGKGKNAGQVFKDIVFSGAEVVPLPVETTA